MDNAGLASLFSSTGTGDPTLDAALGISSISDEEIAAYQAQMQAELVPSPQPAPQAIPQGGPQLEPPLAPQALPKGMQARADYVTPYVQAAADKYGVPPDILMAQMQQESGFKPGAMSNKGAGGWAQFIPSTWEHYAPGKSRADIVAATDAQAHYMRDLYDRFGDWNLALAGYNAGEGAVEKHGRKIPPYKETQNYVRSINSLRGNYAGVGEGAPATQPVAQEAPVQQEEIPLPPGAQRVWLSDGQELFAPQEFDFAKIAESLKAQGLDAVPLKPFTTPAGQEIHVPFDMPDNVALAHLQKSAPDLLAPPATTPTAPGERTPEEGLTAAAASGFKGAAGSIASGLGAEAQELAKKPWMPEFVGEAGQQVGQWLQTTGAELKAKADKYHRPKDMSGFEEKFAYPLAETAGQVGAYMIPYTLPAVGMVAGTASIYGSSMDQLKERAEKEGKQWSPEEARPYALVDTAANTLGMKMLGPLKNMLGKEAVLGARKAITEIAEKEGLDAAKQYVGTRLGNVAKQLAITEAAFTSGEVAEQVIERAYADLPLFDEEALSEYAATAKQVAPLGFVSGVVKGAGARHVKAEAVEHLKEKQAQEQALAQQEAETAQREELANVKQQELAEKKAAKQTVEIPPELQGMPYKDAVNFMRMQEEQAIFEAEQAAAEAAPEIEAPEVSIEEPKIAVAPAPAPEQKVPPALSPADILELKPRSGLRKQLQGLDLNKVEDHPKIDAILQKTSASFSAENSAKLVSLMEEIQNAKPEFEAGQIRSDVSQLSREGQEVRNAPEGGQGVVEEGRKERAAVKGYEVKTPEAPKIQIEVPDVTSGTIEAALPTGAGRNLRVEESSGVISGAGAGRGAVPDVGLVPEGITQEKVTSSPVDRLALIQQEANDVKQRAKTAFADLQSGFIGAGAKGQLHAELANLQKRWDELSTEAESLGKPLTLKEARVVSPDRGIKPIDVPAYADTRNAKELAQRVKTLGTDPELKALTDTIMQSPHLEGIAVKWAAAEDTLPEGVREKFNTGTKAIVDWPAHDVQPTIYFDTTSPHLQEDTAVHELVHGVTEAALQRNQPLAGELKNLSKTVSIALRERAGFAHGSKDMEIADFWDRAVKGDAGELLAYGLTSPTFRQTLEQFGADGKPFKAYRTEAELNALRKGKEKPEKAFTMRAPKELTLWDKFVDTVSRLFGLPAKRKNEFKRQLNEYLDNKAKYEQRKKDYITLKPLHEKLDSAFKELLSDTSEKGIAITAAGAKEAKVEPKAQPAEKVLKESGLVGKMQDKSLGEKMGELGRDLFTEGRSTSFATEGIDARAGLRAGVQPLSSMVGKKLRADLLYSAFEQRGNVIQESYHNGYAALSADGSVQAITNHQLSPKHIIQRVGKKNLELFNNVLVAMRGKTIRAEDRRLKAQADDFLNKADMLEDAAARTRDAKKAKAYNKSANNLRDIAEKTLARINYEEGRTRVTDEEIAAAEEILEANPKLAREAENVYELLRKQVDLWEDAELIDAETADRFRAYENYFPLYKTEEFDEMMIDPSKYVENIVSHMGRGLKSLPNIKAQKHHAHQIFAEKNLLRHIAFMTSAAAQHSAQKNALMQLELTGGAVRQPKGYKKSDGDHSVLVKEKGQPVYYKITDPGVYYAMQAAQPLMSPLLRRLKNMTGFARGVMVVNPLFWFRQLVREPLQASMVGKVGMVTPFDTMAAIARISAGKSEGYKKLRSKGVIGPVDVVSDPTEFVKTALGEKGFVAKGWEGVKHIHEVVDAATREVVYNKAKADGLSKGMDEETASDYAVMRARELINFSKQGRSSVVRALRATTPFFGAALNSMDVMARAAFPDKLGKLSKAEVMEAQRNFYNNAALLALYTTAYAMFMSDDDKYLDSAAKRGFWLVPRDDEDAPFYKIAVNFESGWFTKELPELLTLYNMGAIGKKEALTEGAKGFKELVLPPMPTIFAVEPLVEVAIDHDFYTGNAIDSGKDAREMARFRDRKAGELTKLIVNKMEEKGVNVADLSPNQLEHLFRSYFGQLWAVTRAATDAYLYDGPPKVEKKLSQMPLVSGVMAGAERDKSINQFMDMYHNAAEVERSYSSAQQMSDVAKFETIIQSEGYKNSVRAQQALESTYKRMGEVKNSMEKLENLERPAALKTKQMKELEQQYRTLAKDGVRRGKLLGLEP